MFKSGKIPWATFSAIPDYLKYNMDEIGFNGSYKTKPMLFSNNAQVRSCHFRYFHNISYILLIIFPPFPFLRKQRGWASRPSSRRTALSVAASRSPQGTRATSFRIAHAPSLRAATARCASPTPSAPACSSRARQAPSSSKLAKTRPIGSSRRT
jgi:hypothetical protein